MPSTKTLAICAFLVLAVPLAMAEDEAPPPRAGLTGAATGPVDDVEGGPKSEGEQLRDWTPLLPAELEARDPAFREWVRLIREGKADKRIMRLYWYYRQRLEPFDRELPEGWRKRGAAVLRDEQRTRRALQRYDAANPAAPGGDALRGETPAAPEGSVLGAKDRLRGGQPETMAGPTPGISPHGVWVPIGPYNIAGRTTGLDQPAGKPDTVYAAVADGGVWRTRDAGATWERLSDFEATLSGGSILLDPTDEKIIYFGTGEGNGAIDNYPGIGVLKSTDGGLTWTESNNFSNVVRKLAMHPSDTNRIYAAGAQGCYLSTDAGATFNLIDAPGLPTGTGASDVAVRPDDPNTLYCALWTSGANSGIYRSTDQGANWTRLEGGLPSTLNRVALAIARSNPDRMIAGAGVSGGTVYLTDDGGDSWTTLGGGSNGYCGGQCWYDNAVGIDPANEDIMYAGGVSAYRSLDGGVNWSNMSSGVHVDHHAVLTPSGGEVFLANDGGIYFSSNHGGSWTEWSLGMDTSQYYGICRAATDTYRAFGGTQDNGSHRRRQSDGWRQQLGADGGMCMHGPDASGIIVGEYQNLNIRRSTNDGDSFSDANGGIPSGEPHPWVGILVADPSDRNNMWTSTDRIYRSTDARATSWVNLADPLHCGGIGCMSVTAIEVAPSDSNTVYVGHNAQGPIPPVFPGIVGGIYVSTDALAGTPTWTDVTDSAGFPFRSVRRLRVHPNDPQTVYAVFSGFGANRIFKTTDGGGTWANHTGDLPDVPVNDLVIDGDNPGTIIAATDLAIFRSDDDGATWYGFSNGLPTAAAIEMTFDPAGDKLRVGTHGRSMWDWQEAETTPTAVPDGLSVAGEQLRVAKLSSTTMRLLWDVQACTARQYHLMWGDLDTVATRDYDGATCDLGNSGQSDVTIPTTASGNVYFVVTAADGQGLEGPHGFDALGDPLPANGLGFCGITGQDALATCP